MSASYSNKLPTNVLTTSQSVGWIFCCCSSPACIYSVEPELEHVCRLCQQIMDASSMDGVQLCQAKLLALDVVSQIEAASSDATGMRERASAPYRLIQQIVDAESIEAVHLCQAKILALDVAALSSRCVAVTAASSKSRPPSVRQPPRVPLPAEPPQNSGAATAARTTRLKPTPKITAAVRCQASSSSGSSSHATGTAWYPRVRLEPISTAVHPKRTAKPAKPAVSPAEPAVPPKSRPSRPAEPTEPPKRWSAKPTPPAGEPGKAPTQPLNPPTRLHMKKQALNLMEPEKKEELRNIAVEWEQYEDEVLEGMLKDQLRTFHAKHDETNAATMTHQSRKRPREQQQETPYRFWTGRKSSKQRGGISI